MKTILIKVNIYTFSIIPPDFFDLTAHFDKLKDYFQTKYLTNLYFVKKIHLNNYFTTTQK